MKKEKELVNIAMLDATKEKTKTNKKQMHARILHPTRRSSCTHLKSVHLIIHRTTPIPHMSSCPATNIKYLIYSYYTHVLPLCRKYLISYGLSPVAAYPTTHLSSFISEN